MEDILDKKEIDSLDRLNNRYEILTKPGHLAKLGERVAEIIPEGVKEIIGGVGNSISEQEIYIQAMTQITNGFKIIEEQAAKLSVSNQKIVENLQKHGKINSYQDIPKLRSYEISKAVDDFRTMNLIGAFIEGGGTGYFGFAGLPFNLILSTFIYFRAVQSIAMYYGYDVKNDNEELIIANSVFVNSLSPAKSDINNELSAVITKVMLMSKATIIRETSKKTWTDMAARGGIPLLLTQMRALSHKSAAKALEKAGEKGIENTIFKETFELLGKKLTQNFIKKSIPFVSAGISAFLDTAQMKKVLEYADIFYQKRFIAEKESRIRSLMEKEEKSVIEADFIELDN